MPPRAPRIAIVPILVCLAAACALLAAGSAPATGVAKKSCGTISSTSTYPRAEVIKIRGVRCHKARKVARRFDHEGSELGRWKCDLAHDDPPRLFSCGRGHGGGDLSDRPHALEARGVSS
jgi:hypothetical protein